MGIYLNPKNENFAGTLKADVYVDKTMMLEVLNSYIDKENKYICVSRPRRFGKTIAQNMIAAYYSKGCDSSALFKGLKISTAEGYADKLNKYNVIKIDLNSEYQNTLKKEKMLTRLTSEIREEMREQYPGINFESDDSLAQCLLHIHSKTGETFIIIIDEYDVLVREQVPPPLFNEYLGFLNGLFKSDTVRPAISLAYLTGILPIVRDKIQSKLNNFREYTILDARELAPFVGFLPEEVEELCKEWNMDFEECRRWYDGYTQHGYEIYNPESVVQSMTDHKYSNYWGKTSSYRVINDRVEANFKGTKDAVIRMLAGENVSVNVLQYLNTMDSFSTLDDALTYLIHIGYLAYDEEDESCRIPNLEISREWAMAIATMNDYETTDNIIKASKELLSETLKKNEAAVAAALNESHIHVTSNRSYNNEDALASAIYLAYIYALNWYYIFKEVTAGRGFADVVFVPFKQDIPALIIELKHNKCAESAIDQIRGKQYFEPLKNYKGGLLFVGVNYDEKEKTHECRIEEFTL
ncbi:MAG: AAA family ATPase [Lachnospiraceae bacterium]|nr:AAA family ATPase [Lachnospiraceae bacterium]